MNLNLILKEAGDIFATSAAQTEEWIAQVLNQARQCAASAATPQADREVLLDVIERLEHLLDAKKST